MRRDVCLLLQAGDIYILSFPLVQMDQCGGGAHIQTKQLSSPMTRGVRSLFKANYDGRNKCWNAPSCFVIVADVFWEDERCCVKKKAPLL